MIRPSPTGWVILILGGLVVALLAGLAWQTRRADTARDKVAGLEQTTATLEIERRGADDTAERLDTYHQIRRDADTGVRHVAIPARRALDATEPLDPARADRQLAHDRQLCRLRPGLGGCAATADDAAGGARGVRPLSPAD